MLLLGVLTGCSLLGGDEEVDATPTTSAAPPPPVVLPPPAVPSARPAAAPQPLDEFTPEEREEVRKREAEFEEWKKTQPAGSVAK